MALQFSGGLAWAAIRSDFSYRETVTFDEGIGTGTATRTNSGSGSESDFLVGAYASALFNYSLSEKWGLFAGAQFQYLGHYTHREANREARLDLTQSVFVNVGISLSF